jgi:hypothetical protein
MAGMTTDEVCYLAIGFLLAVLGVRWAFTARTHPSWKRQLGPHGFPTDELIFIWDVVLVPGAGLGLVLLAMRFFGATLGILPPPL